MTQPLEYYRPSPPPRYSFLPAVSLVLFVVTAVGGFWLERVYNGQYTPNFAWLHGWGLLLHWGMTLLFAAGFVCGVVGRRRSAQKERPMLAIVLNALGLVLMVLNFL